MKTTERTQSVPFLAQEYEAADLGHLGRTKALCRLAEAMSRAPGKSIPAATREEKAVGVSGYRFLEHPAVEYGAVMEPHTIQTCERAAAVGQVYVAHDTTDFAYSGEREGLGWLHGTSKKGFLAHLSLAVAADGTRRPLGLLAMNCWARTEPPRKKPKGRKLSGSAYAKLDDKESLRWGQGVHQTTEMLGPTVYAVHVMDREADIYWLMAEMTERGEHFIVRLSRDRAVGAEVVVGVDDRMSEVLEAAPVIAERQVPLSRRKGHPAPASQRVHGPRQERMAKLQVSAMPVMLMRPRYLDASYPKWLAVNVVHVAEVDAPEGVDPVEWTLLTTESIERTEDVLAVVDGYRARWLIEEFNKAIKTGCGAEKLQMESFQTLTNAIAAMVPIAWQLLLLRNLSRTEPATPATQVLTPTQLDVLRAFVPAARLDERPTVRQALLAVADLGGHLKHNGDPGWQVLGRGFERLVALTQGWAAALAAATKKNSAQS